MSSVQFTPGSLSHTVSVLFSMPTHALLEARQVAGAYRKNINGRDARFKNSVQISHRDRTQILFHSAFALKWGIWYFIFTEHHGTHVYPQDEIQITMYRTLPITKIRPPATFGVDEKTLEFGPDPYGELKREAEEEAQNAAESEADSVPL